MTKIRKIIYVNISGHMKLVWKSSRLTVRDRVAFSALSGLVGIQVKRHRVAGKGLEKIQKRASVGLARYPIERKTHQSLLTQHLRNVSDRLKSVPPRLISTSFSIVYSPPFSMSFFLLFFTFISASRSHYHAAMIDIRNYIRVVLRRSSVSCATVKKDDKKIF